MTALRRFSFVWIFSKSAAISCAPATPNAKAPRASTCKRANAAPMNPQGCASVLPVRRKSAMPLPATVPSGDCVKLQGWSFRHMGAMAGTMSLSGVTQRPQNCRSPSYKPILSALCAKSTHDPPRLYPVASGQSIPCRLVAMGRAWLPLSTDMFCLRSGSSAKTWRHQGIMADNPSHRALPPLGRARN